MSRGLAGHALWVLRGNPVTALAFAGVAVMVFAALFGHAIAPYDPLATSAADSLQPPGPAHWFGTDRLGRDILSRVLVATRLDLAVAVSAVALSFAAGASIGAACGYLGGRTDRWVGRGVDVLMAFPLFVLAMALVAALGNSLANVIYATAIINLPFYIRFARAEVNVRRGQGWVEAARASGAGPGAVMFRYLLPNAMPAMMVQISLNMGWSILNAAGLSFIGLGVQPPTPEWGIMVAEGARLMSAGAWWAIAFPSLALIGAVLCFNLLGDGMRDILDPRMRT